MTCKVYVEMEIGVEEILKSEEATKSAAADIKVDLLKDIKCSSGNSSDASELIEVDKNLGMATLGREPSVSVIEKEEEIKSCPEDNLPIQSDVLEDRGTGFNFGKRWSYFNGEIFCLVMGVQVS